VLSDSVAAGRTRDRSGEILRQAFADAGCVVDLTVLPDDAHELTRLVHAWVAAGIELIVTSGGTGLGPRDITPSALEPLFDSRLPGIEQALHARGREKLSTAMLSRLAAGTVGNAIVIAIPGSAGAARDAVEVLIPAIFHAWSVKDGARHA
jgi:molybdenum cofactor synthesis domain-containing protein